MQPLRRTACASIVVLSALVGMSTEAQARPQASATLQLGATRGLSGPAPDWGFSSGLRADVLLGRSSPKDTGYGPYVELHTRNGQAPLVGGGGTMLLPLSPTFPLNLSAGGYLQAEDGASRPGLVLGLGWGLRDYNHHGNYSITTGLLAQLRRTLGNGTEAAATSLQLDAQLDLALLSLPLILAWGVVAGPSKQASAPPPVP